jgi:hypothetical protein
MSSARDNQSYLALTDWSDIALAAILIHLFVDWFLQNDWQAQKKVIVGHPAGILHATMHGAATLLVFPWWAALTVGVTHYAIDLRRPLLWWRRTFRMTTDPNNPAAIHVAFWQDQVSHMLIVALLAGVITHAA